MGAFTCGGRIIRRSYHAGYVTSGDITCQDVPIGSRRTCMGNVCMGRHHQRTLSALLQEVLQLYKNWKVLWYDIFIVALLVLVQLKRFLNCHRYIFLNFSVWKYKAFCKSHKLSCPLFYINLLVPKILIFFYLVYVVLICTYVEVLLMLMFTAQKILGAAATAIN